MKYKGVNGIALLLGATVLGHQTVLLGVKCIEVGEEEHLQRVWEYKPESVAKGSHNSPCEQQRPPNAAGPSLSLTTNKLEQQHAGTFNLTVTQPFLRARK